MRSLSVQPLPPRQAVEAFLHWRIDDPDTAVGPLSSGWARVETAGEIE